MKTFKAIKKLSDIPEAIAEVASEEKSEHPSMREAFSVRIGHSRCPICGSSMLTQDVKHERTCRYYTGEYEILEEVKRRKLSPSVAPSVAKKTRL